jgi:hypothetical protein
MAGIYEKIEGSSILPLQVVESAGRQEQEI